MRRYPSLLALSALVALAGLSFPAWTADLSFTGKLVCSLKRPAILPFPGEILTVEAHLGQAVKEGDVLARYRLAPEAVQALRRRLAPTQAAELRAKLAEVDKGLALLKNKETGLKELTRQNLAAPQSLAQLEREIQALAKQRAALREALGQVQQVSREEEALLRKQLGGAFKSGQVPEEGVLTAPLNGHVVWMHPDLRPGALVKNDTPMLLVGVMDPMLLKARVHEIEALKLKTGALADIAIESLPGRTFQARVGRLPWSPGVLSLEAPTYYEVEFQVPNPDLVLREGLKATLTIREEKREGP